MTHHYGASGKVKGKEEMSALRWLDEKAIAAHKARIGAGAGRIVRPMGPDLPVKPKPAKHKSIPVVVDGIRFASRLEADVYQVLRIRQAAGQIECLRRQVRFSLFAGSGEHIGTYAADFVFDEKGQDGTFKRVVADAKSEHTRTLAAWRRTRKLMMACHAIDVRELP